MRASSVAVALCLLGALVPAMAGVDAAAPMFADWFHALKAGPSTRAKTMGGHQEAHVKHICLQEKLQYNCRYIGCSRIDHSPDGSCNGTTACGDCTHGSFWQSDLTCCGDRDSYGYGEDSTGGFGTGVDTPTLKIGTCDWNVNLFQPEGQPSVGGSVEKLGTAWATCYLTSASEYCGTDLLCDQMVLSFKGGLYEAWVKSTQEDDLQLAFEELSCLPDDVFEGGFPAPERRSRRRRNNNGTKTFDGLADMISGVVTVTSMDRTIEYHTGYMDYVVRFISYSPEELVAAGLPSSLPADKYPTVTPNTYNIKLTSSKGYASS